MTARRIGAGLTVLAMLACIIPTVTLPIVHGEMLGLFGPDLGAAISFAVVGAFLLVRSNVTNLAAIMCVQGVGSSITSLTIVGYNLAAESGPLHGVGLWTAWLNTSVWVPGIALLTPLMLLFPTGRLAAPAWRWLIVATCACGVFFVLAELVVRQSVVDGEPESFAPNPTGFIDSTTLADVGQIMVDGVFICFVVSLASLVVRHRRTTGIERTQLTSLLFGASVSAVVLTSTTFKANPIDTNPLLFAIEIFAVLPIPVSIAIAVLRYRLFEIDKVVSRTVTYALVLAVLAAVYVTVLATLAQLVPDHYGSVGVAVATLLVSALAAPLTRRVRHGVDRRFDRAHVDAQRVTAAFAARLRARPERGDVPADLLDVVHRTVAPSHASVWLVDRH